MAQYKTGSVSVTNGSAVVTGTGTLWVGEVAVGDIFTIVGSNAWYEVGAVNSNTQITLTANYAGTTITDSTYAISRDFTANYGLPYPQKGDIETASLIKRAFQDIDSKLVLTSSDGDVTITGDLIVEGSTISLDNATVQTFTWGDNDKAIFGAGSDLQIYHDGANNYVDGVSGAVFVRGSRIDLRGANNELMLVGNQNGSLISYYDNAAKLATTSTGINVTGLTDTDTLNVSGNTTLGDASTDTVTVNGYMGVGGAAVSYAGAYIQSNALTGTGQSGLYSYPTATAAATSTINSIQARIGTAAASFTVADATSLLVADAIKGAGSTITNQHGVRIADQTQGTNNYGITSLVSSGTNKWNIYASGTAANYFAGDTGVGTTSFDTATKLTIDSTSTAKAAVAIYKTYAYGARNYHIKLGTTYGSGFSGYIANLSAGTPMVLSGGGYYYGGGLYQLTNGATGVTAMTLGENGVFEVSSAAGVTADSTTTTGSMLYMGAGKTVFNEVGADIDFRIESDTNSHAFFLEGSTGNVGIGASSPTTQLVLSGAGATLSGSTTYNLQTVNSTTGFGVRLGQDGANGTISGIGASGLTFWTYNGSAWGERVRITSAGSLLVGTPTAVSNNRLVIDQASGDGANSGFYLQRNGAAGTSFKIDIDSSDVVHFRRSTTDALTLTSAGNLGLGVTPSAWTTLSSVLQIKQASLVSESNDQLYLSANGYYSSGVWKYIASDTATQYYQAAGAHVWRTAPSGTAGDPITFSQAMTLDASGRLGIGVTSLTRPLEVAGTPAIFGSAQSVIRAADTRAFAQGVGGGIVFTGNATTGQTDALTNYAAIHAAKTNSTSSDTSGDLVFSTRKTGNNLEERARITSAGELLVGTTTVLAGARLSVEYDTAPAVTLNRNGTDGAIQVFKKSTVTVGTISVTTSSTAYNTSSDYRLKEDWQPMTGASERVKALNPVNFAWKVDGSRVDGFLAHEAQAVVPEAVTGTKDAVDAEGNPEYQGIDQSKLVPLLTAALQEALAQIESLTARVSALEGN